jgi:SH3-like domain-containing protein
MYRGVRLRVGALALALGWPAAAAALEFRSVAEPAVMYDAPSRQAKALFVVARSTPVEAIVTLEGWVKVRDSAGDIAWIEKRELSEKRMLIVVSSLAEVRRQPDDSAPLVFEAEKDVVLELVESAPPGWAQVRHRDGQVGFVRVNQVWGL